MTAPAAEAEVVVRNKNGLHARPASLVAETALRFRGAHIAIRRGDLEVDAKSIMELLLLEARCGTKLLVRATGDEAKQAVEALRGLFDRSFDLEH